ncbi:MAG: formylglycine-generating enzyme family protein [Cyanobacteria bacterium P01_G01_bin.39]
MHGNVWEWCQDDWHGNYENAPTDGSVRILDYSSNKVIRGGSWFDYLYDCRSAIRSNGTRDVRSNDIGFRVVCVVPRTT